MQDMYKHVDRLEMSTVFSSREEAAPIVRRLRLALSRAPGRDSVAPAVHRQSTRAVSAWPTESCARHDGAERASGEIESLLRYELSARTAMAASSTPIPEETPLTSSTMDDVPFSHRQPTYIRALLQPSSLRGYARKNKSLPAWLDYSLYGPPVIRDSSPGAMAYIFGRTEHDTNWKKKSAIQRGINAAFLIAAYIFFLYVPFHLIITKGVKPYRSEL